MWCVIRTYEGEWVAEYLIHYTGHLWYWRKADAVRDAAIKEQERQGWIDKDGMDRSPEAEADRVDASYERYAQDILQEPHTHGSGQVGEPR